MKIVSAAVLALIPFSVIAEPLPRPTYDADKDCRNFERKDNDKRSANEIYNECFDKQQKVYNKIKDMWGELTESEQKECLQIMNSNSPVKLGPWGKLVFCIAGKTVIAKQEDPGRAMRRKKEQEHRALQQRDDEERQLIPKRDFHY